MHTVVPHGNVEMGGEAGLSQLQPASKFLQITEQGKAEGDLLRLDDVLFWGFRLHLFILFIS